MVIVVDEANQEAPPASLEYALCVSYLMQRTSRCNGRVKELLNTETGGCNALE
jgi:hypothetical protein